MRIFICCCYFALLFNACIQERQTIPAEVIGLAPIYASDDWQDIQILAPQSIENLGKIYYKTPFIYATERGRGIHIIDNSNPEQPKAEAFLQIAGNSDLAIRNQILYANNVNDLVAIDISDLSDLKIVERLANVYQVTGSDFPEGYQGYFECVDPNLGQVVGWFETTLREPECWRQ